jgi:hypothetical protein
MTRRVLASVAAVALALVVGAGGARGQGGPPGVLQIAVLSDVTLNPFTLPQQLPTLMVSKVLFGTLPLSVRRAASGRPRRV